MTHICAKSRAAISCTRRAFVGAACLGASALALGLSSLAPAPARADGEALTVAWTSNQGDTSLDPAYNYMGWQGSYLGIYEQLFRIDGSFEPQPLLAASATSEDFATWTITLRDGVTFQNGSACDAAAVKASLERAIEQSPRCAKALGISSMEADGLVLTVTLAEPNVGFVNELCEPVTSIIDVNAGADAEKPVGTGPFAIQDVDASGNVELAAYDGYWQGAPHVSHVSALYLTDDASKVTALQTGEVQALMNVGDDQLPLFESNPDFTVNQTNQARAHMLYFNMESDVMSDLLVREAVCMCVNRDGLVNAVYGGAAESAPGVFPEVSGYAEGVSQPGYDPDGARGLLEQAGWSDSDGDGYLDKDGKRLTLTFCTYQANAALPKICEVMASDLAQIGVEVKVEVADKIAERLGKGGWDVGTMAYSTLPTGNPATYLTAVMSTDGSANYGHYSSDAVDKLLAQLAGESDHDRRAQIVEDVQKQALGDYAYCYVVHALVNDVCDARVKHLAMQGQYDWLSHETELAG